MEAFKTVIWIINIFSSLAIIALVLMQHGKGADAGASFGGGSGSAQGVFGSGGNANFLTRMTGIAAAIFFASCLALGYVHTKSGKVGGLDFSDVQQTSNANTPSLIQESASQVVTTISASTPVAASSESNVSGMAAAAATGAAAATAKAALDKASDKKSAESEQAKSDKNSKTSTKKATTKKTDKPVKKSDSKSKN